MLRILLMTKPAWTKKTKQQKKSGEYFKIFRILTQKRKTNFIWDLILWKFNIFGLHKNFISLF